MWNRTVPSPALSDGLRPAAELGLTALAILFGLQALRVVLPGMVWVLFDARGWSEALAAAATVPLFLTPLLAGGLERLVGRHRLLLAVAGGLGLLRLLMQVWADSPAVSLGLAMGCLGLFFLFVPVSARGTGTPGRSGAGRFALGLLLGLTLDTALHGAFRTWDLAWQSGALPLVLTLLPVAAQWALIAVLALGRGERDGIDGRESASAAAFVALGPFLFLQLVVLQNIARAATLTGWTLPQAFGWTLLAQIAGLGCAVWLLSGTRRMPWPLAFACGAGLVAVLSVPYPEGPAPAAALLFVGQVLASVLIAAAFASVRGGDPKARFLRAPAAGALGSVLLLALLAGYYLAYYSGVPFDNSVLEPAAALLLGALALRLSLVRGGAPAVSHRAWLAVPLALPLLALPLAQVVTWRAPTAVAGDGLPVRVATYNLHNGFDTEGQLDIEAIASVIEEFHPDIIALQEVSRGWVISGRLDMLSWLSSRLDMPYVFGPTADPLWGNAILSRYPIVDYAEYDLPPRDLPVERGLIAAVVDLGGGETLQVIATHLHHVDEDSAIRQTQAQAIVAVWGGRGRTVLLGDFNAQPADPEIGILRQAGLADAAAPIESPPGYTWPSDDPAVRIDYIWLSPDLQASGVRVVQTTASDHLPVVAEIAR